MAEEKKRPEANGGAQPKKIPVGNPALTAAITKLKGENTPQNLNVVINEMMRTVFMAPAVIEMGKAAPKPDANGRIALPKDTKINFMLLTDPKGKRYYMAFTDPQELKKWKSAPKSFQSMVLRFDDFANMLEKNHEAAGLVINPFGETIRFEAPMIAALKKQKAAFAQQRAQTQIKPGDKVTIVEPTVLPDELLNPICEVLKGNETIAAAYLQVMIINGNSKSYLLVLDGPQEEALFRAVAQAARPYLSASGKQMNLNITTSAAPLGQQGMRGSDPFYRKGEGRIYEEEDDE